MQNNIWKQELHVEPSKGWLNDPNGLAYYKGNYHIFHQYSYEVEGGLKYWYYYTSKDLINFIDKGVVVSPDNKYDKEGVYSGSAHVEDDKLVFYYTGNVKHVNENEQYDYIHSGRGHNTIKFISEDGINFGEKEVVLENKHYPNMSNHVRDPKIFEKNGKQYLVLGGRDNHDYGCLLIYNNENSEHVKTVYSKQNLGFMWECPDYFEVDNKEIFMFSPQGISRMYHEYKNMYQIGYSVIEEGIEKLEKIDNFSLLDYGHDFYAAQTFLDKDGERVLIGWMAVPDSSYTNPITKYGYQHCLTIPRTISYSDGKLRQRLHSSVKELFSKEILEREFIKNSWYFKQNSGDNFSIKVDDFELKYENKVLFINFGNTGYGRDDRKYKLDLENVEVVFDSSSIELFANDGQFSLSSRFYPNEQNVKINAKDYFACELKSIEVKKEN